VDKPLRDFFLELKRVAQFVAPGPAVFASRADLEDAAAHTADVPISAALELSEDVLDAVKDDASAQMDAVKLAVAAQGLRNLAIPEPRHADSPVSRPKGPPCYRLVDIA